MNFSTRKIWFIFIGFFTCFKLGTSYCQPPGFRGIFVTYKNFQARNSTSIASFHQSLNSQVEFRLKNVPAELIILTKETENTDPIKLEQLCSRYLKRPEVKQCDLNRKTEIDSDYPTQADSKL